MNSDDFTNRVRNEQFQREMQSNNQLFQRQMLADSQRFQQEMTNKFITEYTKTNRELKAINDNLQKQLDDTKRSAKSANIKSWISIGVSIASVIVALIVGFCT